MYSNDISRDPIKLVPVCVFLLALVLFVGVTVAADWTPVGPSGVRVRNFAVSPGYPADQTFIVSNFSQPTTTYITKNGGGTWTTTTLSERSSGVVEEVIFDGTPNRAYTAGNNAAGGYTTSDGGLTWSRYLDYSHYAFTVDANPSTVFYGEQNKVGISSDSGTTFTWISFGTNGLDANAGQIFAIKASPSYTNDHTLFIGTGWKGMFKTVDGGLHWTKINSGLPPFNGSLMVEIQDIVISPDFENDNTLFVMIWGDGLYKSTDGGSTWNRAFTRDITATPRMAISPDFSNDRTIFFSGYVSGNQVYKSTDRGNSWSEVDTSGFSSAIRYTGFNDIQISPAYGSDKRIFLGTKDGVWTTQIANQAPTLNPVGNTAINEGQTLQFTLSASDPDSTTLTYFASSLPEGASLSGTGFSWTPAYNQAGTYEITFTVSDGTLTDEETITITVLDVSQVIRATVNIDPDTLNLKSNGNPVTVSIDLPSGLPARDIVIGSLRLEGLEVLKKNNKYSSEIQGTTLMAQFSRQDLKQKLSPGEQTLTLTGSLTDGRTFSGHDTIRVK